MSGKMDSLEVCFKEPMTTAPPDAMLLSFSCKYTPPRRQMKHFKNCDKGRIITYVAHLCRSIGM